MIETKAYTINAKPSFLFIKIVLETKRGERESERERVRERVRERE